MLDYGAMNTRSLLAPAVVFALGAFVAAPVSAQLAAPNASGAAIGHIHINASDVDAQSRFWTAIGGKIVQREKITMVQFPGIYVLLRKQDYTGGSVGSTINHFGFYVKDFDAIGREMEGGRIELGARDNPVARAS